MFEEGARYKARAHGAWTECTPFSQTAVFSPGKETQLRGLRKPDFSTSKGTGHFWLRHKPFVQNALSENKAVGLVYVASAC